MRPKSIRLFAILYIASTLLGVVGPILLFAYPDMGQLRAAGMGYPVYLSLGVAMILLVAFALPLWLFQQAVQRQARWAYWAILAIGAVSAVRFVLLLLQFQHAMSGGAPVPWPYGIAMPLGILAALLHMMALAFLFTAEARAWFKAKPSIEPVEETD